MPDFLPLDPSLPMNERVSHMAVWESEQLEGQEEQERSPARKPRPMRPPKRPKTAEDYQAEAKANDEARRIQAGATKQEWPEMRAMLDDDYRAKNRYLGWVEYRDNRRAENRNAELRHEIEQIDQETESIEAQTQALLELRHNKLVGQMHRRKEREDVLDELVAMDKAEATERKEWEAQVRRLKAVKKDRGRVTLVAGHDDEGHLVACELGGTPQRVTEAELWDWARRCTRNSATKNYKTANVVVATEHLFAGPRSLTLAESTNVRRTFRDGKRIYDVVKAIYYVPNASELDFCALHNALTRLFAESQIRG